MSQSCDQSGRIFVPEKFEIYEVELCDGEELGERIDLRLLTEAECIREGRRKTVLMFLLWLGFFVVSIVILAYAFVRQNDSVICLVLSWNGAALIGPIIHYFGIDVLNGKKNENKQGRLSRYLRLLRKVAGIY